MLFALSVPVPLQWIGAITAAFVALGAFWAKVIRPSAKLVTEIDRSLPVMRALTDKLQDTNVIDVIVSIANQFKTDSGSSLRDVVNRLEDAAIENKLSVDDAKAVVDVVRIAQEANRLLTEGDRVQIARLVVLLDALQVQIAEHSIKILGAATIAANLAAGVASDLKDSHARANQAGNQPGESADAFSLQPEDPEDPVAE